MTVYSQNGYVAKDASLIGKYTVPGTSVAVNIRKGDVSVVLLDLMSWFDKHVQKLRQADTGGYNPRSIIGSSTISNHASGTAVDLDWNSHPLGKVNTFTSAQEAAIHARLKYYDGVVRWGGDYTGRKDEMHFEINKAPSYVAALVKKIKNPPHDHLAGSRTLSITKPLMFGYDVRVCQERVGLTGTNVDGWYGINTSNHVKTFQKANSLRPVDGICGPKTWAAMGIKYIGK